MTLFRLHMVKQILPSGRKDDQGLQETIYRPREELYKPISTTRFSFSHSNKLDFFKCAVLRPKSYAKNGGPVLHLFSLSTKTLGGHYQVCCPKENMLAEHQ